MKRNIFLLVLLFTTAALAAEGFDYQFRLMLKDKGTTLYSTDRPEEFLSQKAIDRRTKQNIIIDVADLPVSADYIATIEQTGGVVVAKSRWLNTVSVHCTDSLMVDNLKKLPFVDSALFVWRGKKTVVTTSDTNVVEDATDTMLISYNNGYEDYYGFAAQNVRLQNGQALHDSGYKGEGIDIAVLDAGYNNLKQIELLDNINIKGSKTFVFGDDRIFENANQHGLNVLSCMATNKPHRFVGTAPEANYWLLRSEDSRSEFPIEEDYWVMAVEYADSIGVDIVNSSLGYNQFDYPAASFLHSDLNGKNTHITRGADMAIRKGMIVVCSAGNSGNSKWKKLTPPADANLILTVGAMESDSTIARFSSQGYTYDLRIKPDVVALGSRASVIDDKGETALKSGTSFSSPIMCGLVACLWQAYPTLTNREILNIVRQSSNRYETPDEFFGYGIPDMEKAMLLAQKAADLKAKRKK